MFVDDVDEYIRAEETRYQKVSKLNMPKKPKNPNMSREELDLAKKDGLDANSILSKRRRSEKSPDKEEHESRTQNRKTERSSSSDAEPEFKRKKLLQIVDLTESPVKPAKTEKIDAKFKSALPEQLKGSMNREAENKYNAMIAQIFGSAKRP